jgi:hypothetical protein
MPPNKRPALACKTDSHYPMSTKCGELKTSRKIQNKIEDLVIDEYQEEIIKNEDKYSFRPLAPKNLTTTTSTFLKGE